MNGKVPAIALINPKFRHNLGAAIRASSCFGISQVWYTGNRIQEQQGERVPREERMYRDVELVQKDYFLDQFARDTVPVAVEIRPGSEMLPQFEHPENALYIFGPEDGDLQPSILRHCRRFVTIPTAHCTNLAGAVYIVLYDRRAKRQLAGLEPFETPESMLAESRGFMEV